MPRPKCSVPRFCVDATGRAFCKVNGRFITLGRGDTPATRERYTEELAKLSRQQTLDSARQSVQNAPKPRPTVNELFLRYSTDELPRFSHAEQHCQKCAMRIAREMFGGAFAADFGPLKLRLVRDAMVAGDPHAVGKDGKPKPRKPWSRSFTNKQVKRLRAVFRWGVSWELVPQTVVDALGAVRSLVAGETEAAESTPRKAVSKASIDAVRAKLKQRHRDAFDLLLLTGARPGELIGLTTGSIDRSGDIWRADLAQHKTAHKGKSRTLYFNATAQLILQKYLKADPEARLFPFSRVTFGNVVKAACQRANVQAFVPHQLRHTVVTRLVDELGIEFAQRVAGHATAAMTEHYSRAAEAKAVEAVKRLG